jgi:hypothetical protein
MSVIWFENHKRNTTEVVLLNCRLVDIDTHQDFDPALPSFHSLTAAEWFVESNDLPVEFAPEVIQ